MIFNKTDIFNSNNFELNIYLFILHKKRYLVNDMLKIITINMI
jgi:hypothetical protein